MIFHYHIKVSVKVNIWIPLFISLSLTNSTILESLDIRYLIITTGLKNKNDICIFFPCNIESVQKGLKHEL